MFRDAIRAYCCTKMRCSPMISLSLCLSIVIGTARSANSAGENVTVNSPILLEMNPKKAHTIRDERHKIRAHLSNHQIHEDVENALSGYLVIRRYFDQNCRDLSKVDSTLLNTCIPDSTNTTAVMWTANTTSVSKTEFADPQCSTPTSFIIRLLRKRCASNYAEFASNETSYEPISSAISFRCDSAAVFLRSLIYKRSISI